MNPIVKLAALLGPFAMLGPRVLAASSQSPTTFLALADNSKTAVVSTTQMLSTAIPRDTGAFKCREIGCAGR